MLNDSDSMIFGDYFSVGKLASRYSEKPVNSVCRLPLLNVLFNRLPIRSGSQGSSLATIREGYFAAVVGFHSLAHRMISCRITVKAHQISSGRLYGDHQAPACKLTLSSLMRAYRAFCDALLLAVAFDFQEK